MHRLDEQLFFPGDVCPSYDLRQHTAHDCFNWTAIVGANPSRQFEQVLAQHRTVADDCFDRPDTFCFTVFRNGDHCGERRFLSERHANARAHSDPVTESFGNYVIELATDRPIDDDANVIGLWHVPLAIHARARAPDRDRLL